MDDVKLGLAFAAAEKQVLSIEPSPGHVDAAALPAIAAALDDLAATQGDHTIDERFERQIAEVYAHAAAVAIATGDDAHGDRWLAEAERRTRDKDREAEYAAGRRSPERYRALLHGRFLVTNDRKREARTIWRALRRRHGERDAIARAAATELAVARPIGPEDPVPTPFTYNGFGTRFYGRRAIRKDGIYTTTYCVSALWIPVLPLSAWLVRDDYAGYAVLARAPLSRFARTVRWALPAALVLMIASGAIITYLQSPERLARQRWDAALAQARTTDTERALQQLDTELTRDVDLVDAERAERAGAEVVRLAASRVARPLTLAALDQTTRAIRRFQTLPPRARDGTARTAMLDALDSWTTQLGSAADSAEARLRLLRVALDLALAENRAPLVTKLTATALAIATAKQADWPLDALAVLVVDTDGNQDQPTVLAADRIPVARRARSTIADAIRATQPWADVAAYARADRSQPTLNDLRLARLLGDPVLEAAARPVLDDPLTRMLYELQLLLYPRDEDAKAQLAYLKAR